MPMVSSLTPRVGLTVSKASKHGHKECLKWIVQGHLSGFCKAEHVILEDTVLKH